MASLKQIEFSIRFFGVCLLHVSISVLSKHCIFLSYLKREQGLDSVHSSERIWFHWSGITCIPRLLWAEWLKKKTTAQCWAVIGILAVIVVFIFFSAVIVRPVPTPCAYWMIALSSKEISFTAQCRTKRMKFAQWSGRSLWSWDQASGSNVV